MELGSYSTREVAGLADLPPAQVRALARARVIEPARGPDGKLRYSFRDLVVLRSARTWMGSERSTGRVARMLRRLQEQLPDRPLSGVRLDLDGSEPVALVGDVRWNPESGQWLLPLGAAAEPPESSAVPLRSADPRTADAWFALGCALEREKASGAEGAYRQALAIDPRHGDAWLNLGRLLHEAGSVAEAEGCYREAITHRPGETVGFFNLGCALEDLGRLEEALGAYEEALRRDAACADAHYNLALLYQRLGRPEPALRHLQSYRRLL